jgi:glutamate N-acetyltransferase/amino-acid N-acetyltransferase
MSERHITLPEGFTAAGVTAGIKASGKRDLALIAADKPVPTALVTTTNQVVGAPVIWCRRALPRGYGEIRAVVVNSGCSNVCTGDAGLRDAREMAGRVAEKLSCDPQQVLVCSTGVIGQRLPMDLIRKGIDQAALSLGREDDSAVVQAIMTTDTREKSAKITGKLGGKEVTVAGIIKGAGMIAPSLATMLCYVTTDAAVSPAALGKVLTGTIDGTLNAVTIDSDTSTSDTTVLMAGGAAGNKTITGNSAELGKFAELVGKVLESLARQMAADGEGATRLIEIAVSGAKSPDDARLAAKSVADSPLVKCAVHGADPNWGRIVMALGKSPAKVVGEKLTVKIGGTTVFARGMGRRFDASAVAEYLARPEVQIHCDLGLGKGRYTAYTCDLSRQYVTINADYHT